MVTLPAGDYNDWTTALVDDEYNLAAAYNPVKWTLKKDGVAVTGCENVLLSNIQDYLTTTLSAEYDVEGGEFSTINGTYTLDWNWGFEVNDQADTTLGQIAAGVEAAPAGHVASESFEFSITVTQID